MPDPAAPTKHMDLSATSRAAQDSAGNGDDVAGCPGRCSRLETEGLAYRIDDGLTLAADMPSASLSLSAASREIRSKPRPCVDAIIRSASLAARDAPESKQGIHRGSN
jgi:hypothetical protein